jgi:hypothetical protein
MALHQAQGNAAGRARPADIFLVEAKFAKVRNPTIKNPPILQ